MAPINNSPAAFFGARRGQNERAVIVAPVNQQAGGRLQLSF